MWLSWSWRLVGSRQQAHSSLPSDFPREFDHGFLPSVVDDLHSLALTFLAHCSALCVAVWSHVLPHGIGRFKIFRKCAMLLASVCYPNLPSAMPVFESRLDPNSTEFQANSRHHQQLAEELRDRLQEVGKGGSERSRQRHESRGKLLPRERVNRLLDPGVRFWKRHLLRRGGCMTTKFRPLESSLESDGFPDGW